MSHPLYLRYLRTVAQIRRRADVTVHRLRAPDWGYISAKWKGRIPDEMYALYHDLNGSAFYYSFKGESAVHGFSLMGLNESGRHAILPSGAIGPKYQIASKYPEGFFQPGALPKDAPVLFILGDEVWGLILVGEGETAQVYRWEKGGQVTPLTESVIELLTRLIDAGFARTWFEPDHPETEQVKARLAVPSKQTTCEITVKALERQPAFEYHREVVTAWTPEQREKVAKGLGLKGIKGATADELITPLALALGRPKELTDKGAKAALAALGIKYDPTVAHLTNRFGCDATEIVTATLYFNHAPRYTDEMTLVRLLVGVEGLNLVSDIPNGDFFYGDTHPPKLHVNHSPFLAFDGAQLVTDQLKWGKAGPLTAIVRLTNRRAEGLEVGATYDSCGLPDVQSTFGY